MELNNMEAKHRARILGTLSRIPRGLPSEWQKTELSIPVAGLTYIGFSEKQTAKLVCISGQGQSLVDCMTGEVQFCAENYDECDLIALSDGLGDEIVHIAGLTGGGLRRSTRQGEGLWVEAPNYPKEMVILSKGFHTPFDAPGTCSVLLEDYGLLTCGFSRCGNFIAIANDLELIIYQRKFRF